MVSSLSECSTKLKDNALLSSRNRSQEEDSFDSENGSSTFEFHKEHVSSRSPIVPPFSKPAPSKWDDAQKWIASPTSNRQSKGSGAQKKMEKVGLASSRQQAAKVVMEIADEIETKRIDPSQVKKEICRPKAVNWVPDPLPEPDSCAKTAFIENVVADSSISHICHDSTSLQSATTLVTPLSTVRSVSMRDMGTEMTPIASQEPSRTGTPVTATTPLRSPNSSRQSTPRRTAPSPNSADTSDKFGDCTKELSEKELQMKTRREIMILGTQLGKTNIAAWASKEEEETAASVYLKTLPVDQPGKNVIEIRAAAWEDAETAKYLARFQREEIKIQAWENHQKAKTEAELRKIEVEVERMRARSQEKLMNKLAASRHKAEEMRALAEAKRSQQAAKTAQQAEYIRRTGRVPPPFSCWSWCS
ncbi:uncharacterized protein [Typha angustifolia]